jgi:hypothetical protein
MPIITSEDDQQLSEDLHGMVREDIQPSANKQENQGISDYIEVWFQKSISPRYSFIIQHFLEPYQSEYLEPYIWKIIELYFLYLDMS